MDLRHLATVLLIAAGLAVPVHPLPLIAIDALPASLARRSSSVNLVLAMLADMLPFDVVITGVSDVIISVEQEIADLLDIQTAEKFPSNGDCTDLSVIFARGTDDPGNVGVVVGPELLDALVQATTASVAMQGVAYPASVDGFLAGGDEGGSQTMAENVKSGLSSCPSTKLVMAGYSQGGQLVHNAASMLGASLMASISSVVIFGDPDNSTAVDYIDSGRVLIVCHTGDNICEGGDIILLPHVTYAEDAGTAAAFIVAAAGL